MSREQRDRILGIVAVIFAAILLIANTYGTDLPELFIQACIVAFFGFLAWLAMALFRWRLGYRISVTVWSILLIIFLMLLNDETAPNLYVHISAAALIISMTWILFQHGRVEVRR